MSTIRRVKGPSVLAYLRLLFALAATACLARIAPAELRRPTNLPPSEDRAVSTAADTLYQTVPLLCTQSAAAPAPAPSNETQSAEAASPPSSRQDSQQDSPLPSSQTRPVSLDQRDRIFYPSDTERLKPLLSKLFLNILLDQKDIFTSPFRMNRDNAKWWFLSGAVTATLIVYDRRIANSLENSRGQVQWGGRISQVGASYTLVPLVAGYYGFGVLADHAKAREIGVLGTESLLDSLIVAGVLKEVFRRNRPDENNPGDFWGGGTSFPSGHAIQVWSVASLVSHEYKHQPVVAIVAYSLAGVVSASRIAAQKHFASDVFVGGAMGWFIGRYVYDTHMSHLAHKHSSLVPLIIPQFQMAGRSYGVTLLFRR